jgi:hypothetical protein
MEIVGWLATVVIIISFMFKDIVKLRLFSLIGAFLWVIYGVMDNAHSIIILNVVIAIIQVYWLVRLRNKVCKEKGDKE